MTDQYSNRQIADTVLKIGVAGLLHDIGKFADGSVIEVQAALKDREGDFRPKYNGRYTHAHALQGAAFFDEPRVRDHLPSIFNDPQWGIGEPDDIVQNVAACHHNPHTVLQDIVATADQISSGTDRSTYDDIQQRIDPRDYLSTRLTSIFSAVAGADTEERAYDLASLESSNLRPRPIKEYEKEIAKDQYRALFDGFLSRLRGCDYAIGNPRLWINLLNAALAEFTWCIPAARAGNSKPDVSLYDHSRLVAALSVALFRYHHDTGTLTREAVRSKKNAGTQKFVLIGGDLFGIQDYLFTFHGNVQRHRAKLLRGRSLSVALFAKAVANKVCRSLGLSDLSVVSDVAGKFLLIGHNVPNTHNALAQLDEEVNNALLKEYYGELKFGLSWMPCSETDLTVGSFQDTYQRFIAQAEDNRYRQGHGAALGCFAPSYFHDIARHGVCAFSGRVPASAELRGRKFNPEDSEGNPIPCSRAIRDQGEIGTLTTRDDFVMVVNEKPGEPGKEHCHFIDELGIEFVDRRKLGQLPSSVVSIYATTKAERSEFIAPFPNTLSIPRYRADDIALLSDRTEDGEALNVGDPIQFEDLERLQTYHAEQENGNGGVAAIAALKVDVDRLGWIMQQGLGRENYSLSKVNTLSRMLATFFNVRVPALQQDKENPDFRLLYTVFAGGDDLFMIGPWRAVIRFARRLEKEFVEFTGYHKKFHFSAGITLHKSHTSTARMADAAETALDQAKAEGGNRVMLFDSVVDWRTLHKFSDISRQLTEWVDNGIFSEGFLYRLGTFADMSEEERRIQQGAEAGSNLPLDALRWRALLHYQCARNIAASAPRDTILQSLVRWLQEYRRDFRIPYSESVYARRS